MKSQVQFALLHPVFDPLTQITMDHRWMVDRFASACLTVNIGME